MPAPFSPSHLNLFSLFFKLFIIGCVGSQRDLYLHPSSELQYVGSSSLSRDWTQASCTGSMKSCLNHQGSPWIYFLMAWIGFWNCCCCLLASCLFTRIGLCLILSRCSISLSLYSASKEKYWLLLKGNVNRINMKGGGCPDVGLLKYLTLLELWSQTSFHSRPVHSTSSVLKSKW